MPRDRRRRYAIIAAVATLVLELIGVWLDGEIGTILVGLGGLVGVFLLVLTVYMLIVDFLV